MAESLSFRSQFRRNREILRFGPETDCSPLTLFLGTFNAMEYLSSLEVQLSQQSDKNFRLVIADNISSDDTWLSLISLAKRLEVSTVLVKNPVNLGFHGSLKLNEDLLESTWVGFMNQDDIYLPDHVKTLNLLARDATEDIAILSTGLGAVSPNGARLQTPPRAVWQLGSTPTQLELIVATIAQHVLPEPSIAYRRNVLQSISTAWHSTAFPDTEIVLNALTLGGARLSRKETVLYRESPTSASHHLNSEQRSFGAALSLSRFLTSLTLVEFEKTLSPAQANYFVEHVIASLRSRLGPTKEFELCALSFLEQRIVDSHYDTSLAIRIAAEIYFEKDASRAAATLDAIVGTKRRTRTTKETVAFKTLEPSANMLAVVLNIYQRIARFMPRRLNTFLGSVVMRALGHLPQFASWKFRKEPRK